MAVAAENSYKTEHCQTYFKTTFVMLGTLLFQHFSINTLIVEANDTHVPGNLNYNNLKPQYFSQKRY